MMSRFAYRLLLGGMAAFAIAAPAAARDATPYVGVEAGVFVPLKSDIDRQFNSGGNWVDFLQVKHKLGWDADLIGGYDFGMFRLEGEIARKHATHKNYQIEPLAP